MSRVPRLLPFAAVAAAGAVVALGLTVPASATPAAAPAVPHSQEAVPTAGGGALSRATVKPVPPYVPVRASGQPVPATPTTLPAAIDPLPEYQGQRECSPAAKPGAVKLANLLLATYGSTDIGIDRACDDGGQSEHKEGRAIDWMFSYKVPAQRAKVEAFLWWLLKPDAAGHAAANARRLGIMYMGWHDRFWASYRLDSGWTELKGCFATPGADYDTYCHRDHLHMTLSWDAAAGMTSFWDNTAETLSACPRPDNGSTALGALVGTTVKAIPLWRLVDTRAGVGTPDGPCRLESDRWDGDGRAVEVAVLGRHGVPASGVAAVRLHVQVASVNAPTSLVASGQVESTSPRTWTIDGMSMTNSRALQLGRAVAMDLIAPVSNNGTVVLTDLYGALDVRAFVTGWVPIGVPPTPTPAIPPFPGGLLQLGSTGAAVTALQRGLITKGYRIPGVQAHTAPYGAFGAETKAAVIAYQAKHPALGAATGQVDATLYHFITKPLAVATPAPTPPSTPVTTPPPAVVVSLAALLRHASASVKVVQAALNLTVKSGLAVDGAWGPRTQAAFDLFRAHIMHLSGAAATGTPGTSSLTALGKLAGFTVTA